MALKAGERITAARLLFLSDAAALTDTATFTAAGGFEQWGTEEVTFANPGVAVNVQASLSGRLLDTIDAGVLATVRLGISFDGGSTFTYGNAPQIDVGTGGSARAYIGAHHHRVGTPTGSIVIRAEVDVGDDDVDGRSGQINAFVIPQ